MPMRARRSGAPDGRLTDLGCTSNAGGLPPLTGPGLAGQAGCMTSLIAHTKASKAQGHGGGPAPSISMRLSTVIVVIGIVASSLYALMADDPYRGLAHEKALAAVAQDVFSVVVAVALLFLVHRGSAQAHVIRLG